MLKNITLALIASFGLLSVTAQAQDWPTPEPTARDVYVSCWLYVNNADVPKDAAGKLQPFSSERCGVYSLVAITYREGRSKTEDNRYRFCLPNTAELSTDSPRAMAFAYVDYFESRAAQLASKDGKTAYTAAMILKWPCPAQ
jgi:hypothetical protein